MKKKTKFLRKDFLNAPSTRKVNLNKSNLHPEAVTSEALTASGITLIALVITIIVLLILAGVSLSLVAGGNGILGRATNAVAKHNDASIAEEVELAMAELQTQYYDERYVQGTTSESWAGYAKTKLESESGVSTSNGTITLSGTTVSYIPTGENTATAIGSFDTSTGEVAMTGSSTQSTRSGKLLENITSSDYGKSINYSVQVTDQSSTTDPKAKVTLNNWKVFLNDGSNVYIILDDYLEAKLAPTADNILTDSANNYAKKYSIWTSGSGNRTAFINYLTTESNWNEFTKTIQGNATTATGSPTLAQLEASYGTENLDGITLDSTKSNYSLYIPHANGIDNCYGYWLASPSDGYYDWYVYNTWCGYVSGGSYESGSYSVRPVVCLPADTIGTVGDSVTID